MFQIGQVMKRVGSTVSLISTSLMDDKHEGEPEDEITLRDATIVVAKESIAHLNDASFSYKHGKLKMKNVKTRDANQCCERQVISNIVIEYCY